MSTFRKRPYPLDRAYYFRQAETGKVVTRYAEFYLTAEVAEHCMLVQTGKAWRQVVKLDGVPARFVERDSPEAEQAFRDYLDSITLGVK